MIYCQSLLLTNQGDLDKYQNYGVSGIGKRYIFHISAQHVLELWSFRHWKKI